MLLVKWFSVFGLLLALAGTSLALSCYQCFDPKLCLEIYKENVTKCEDYAPCNAPKKVSCDSAEARSIMEDIEITEAESRSDILEPACVKSEIDGTLLNKDCGGLEKGHDDLCGDVKGKGPLEGKKGTACLCTGNLCNGSSSKSFNSLVFLSWIIPTFYIPLDFD